MIRTRLLQAGGKDALAGTIASLAIEYDQRVGYTVLDNIKVGTSAGSNLWTCAADNAAATLLGSPTSTRDDLSVNPFTDSELLSLDELWPTMTTDDQAIATSTDPVTTS